MKTLFCFVLLVLMFSAVSLFGTPPAQAGVLEKALSYRKATVIVDGKEFILFIPTADDKDTLRSLLQRAGLKTVSQKEAKEAKKAGRDILLACLRGNLILTEAKPAHGAH